MKELKLAVNHALELKKTMRLSVICGKCGFTATSSKISADPFAFARELVKDGWKFRMGKKIPICPNCIERKAKKIAAKQEL